MSDSGDDEGFLPHPGDPWHPEWSDESLAGDVSDAPIEDGEATPRKRRGLFRRKPKDRGPVDAGDEPVDHLPETPEVDEGWDDIPATVYGSDRAAEIVPATAEPTDVVVERVVPVDARDEGPLPAWLSDVAPEERDDPTIAVELPTWAGDVTAGADDASGGFDETDASPAGLPAADDLATALKALGALEDADDVEVVAVEAAEEQRPLFDTLPTGALAPLDPVPEEAAAASEYGVAPKEAFEALRDLGDGDLGAWEAFAGSGDPLPAPPRQEDVPATEAIGDWAEQTQPRKRGIWPFRRRGDRDEEGGDEEDLGEEPAEWVGDASAVPEGWFAVLDEDEVVPPSADVPETEWPEPEPVTPSGSPTDSVPLPPVLGDWSAPPFGAPDEHIPQPGSAERPRVPDALFRPPDDLPLESEAVPVSEPEPEDAVAVADDDDQWVTGPIELSDAYDDATIELPADYASEEITEQMYRTSATMDHRGFAEELARVDEDTEWQAISAAMPGVGTGVVGFDDVADLGDQDDVYEAPTRSELGTRVLTGIVLIGFLVGSVWVGAAAAAAFIGLLVVLGLGEFYRTLRHRGFRPLALFGYLGGVGMLSATWFHGAVAIPVAIGLTSVLVFFIYAFVPMRRDALTNGGLTILGLTWVVGSVAFVVPILRTDRYRVLILAIVVVTAAMDIGAYSVGRTWGRTALAPILSPNKSVEGLVGGIAACIGAAAVVGYLIDPFDLKSGLALGAVICLVAPVGDLAESMIKRSLGVKDMGAVLPGHGGILDRVDAFLFVLPAAWVLLQTIGLLG